MNPYTSTPEERAMNRFMNAYPELRGIPYDDALEIAQNTFQFHFMVLGEAASDLKRIILDELEKLIKGTE